MKSLQAASFFGEATVTGASYLDALQTYIFPQLKEDKPKNFILQQDIFLLHWHNSECAWLNNIAPNHWIGHLWLNDRVCFRWPQCLPDLTNCNFYLCEFIRAMCTCLHYQQTYPTEGTRFKKLLRILVQRYFSRYEKNLLMERKIWEELSYRLDGCHVTKGDHIEYL